jgi:purine-nucleoside phosphorylase
MSTHIGAKAGDIAPTVLLPGDPLRAEWVAERFLDDVKLYTEVRGMLGFTGIAPKGKLVSVQGSGMGMPSLSIYVNELVAEYGVKCIIRIGSCGALQKDMKTGDIVLAAGACSNAGTNARRFKGMQFAPLANWPLLLSAYEAAGKLGIPVRVGNVFSTELFYNDVDPDEWELWAKYGVLAVDMESSELYTLGANREKGFQALTILTVSDVLPTGEQVSASDRQSTFVDMVRIALEIS